MPLRFFLSFALTFSLSSWQMQTVAGSRSASFQKKEIFMQSFVQEESAVAGFYLSSEQKMFFGEGYFYGENLTFKAGHLQNSYGSGYLLSNGGFFPQFLSLATERPLGATFIYQNLPIYLIGAGYVSLKSEQSLGLLGVGLLPFDFWEVKAYFRKVLFAEGYYLSNLAKFKTFSLEILTEKENFRQAILTARFLKTNWYAVYFINPIFDDFMAKVYQRQKSGFFLFWNSPWAKGQFLQREEYLVSQMSFCYQDFSFYHRLQKALSLQGISYEMNSWGPLIQLYYGSLKNTYQAVFGLHYVKKIKLAITWGNSSVLVPVAPLFWPNFYDIDNMRSEQILFVRNKVLSYVFAVEWANFSFYAFYNSLSTEEIPVAFRMGYQTQF